MGHALNGAFGAGTLGDWTPSFTQASGGPQLGVASPRSSPVCAAVRLDSGPDRRHVGQQPGTKFRFPGLLACASHYEKVQEKGFPFIRWQNQCCSFSSADLGEFLSEAFGQGLSGLIHGASGPTASECGTFLVERCSKDDVC